MTKSEARAILAARKTITAALDRVRAKLSPREQAYFDAYWGAHIHSIISGRGHGSAPIAQAEDTLDSE